MDNKIKKDVVIDNRKDKTIQEHIEFHQNEIEYRKDWPNNVLNRIKKMSDLIDQFRSGELKQEPDETLLIYSRSNDIEDFDIEEEFWEVFWENFEENVDWMIMNEQEVLAQIRGDIIYHYEKLMEYLKEQKDSL